MRSLSPRIFCFIPTCPVLLVLYMFLYIYPPISRQIDSLLSAGLCRPEWIHPSRVICNILLLQDHLPTLLTLRPNVDGDEIEWLVTRVIHVAFDATGPFLVHGVYAAMSTASLRESGENAAASHVPDSNQQHRRTEPSLLPLGRP